ncbi:MAG: glycosyltransferase [Desulfuromonadales bacterium]|nr:glycosyltransferase [Desulfuromonadales bacterium]
MKKKIVFLDQRLDGGGAERVLCTIMRSLDPASYDIHLVLVGHLGTLKHLVPDYVKVHELRIANTRKALFPFISIMRSLKPSILFSTLSRTTLLSLLARPLCPRFRVIARYPNMPSLETQEGGLSGWRRWLNIRFYRYAEVVIAQTAEMAKELVDYYNIPSQKVKVVNNPIDTSHIDSSLVDQKSPFSTEHINVVASGRLLPQKGFDFLIKSFSEVVKSNKNYRLHILGENINNGKNLLEGVVRSLQLSEFVTFHGYVNNPYPFYQFCDVYVLSSRWEGFPNTLLECLYLNKPIVSTRCVPIIERIVTDGENGFLVEVGDKRGLCAAILKASDLTGIENRLNFSINKFTDLFL